MTQKSLLAPSVSSTDLIGEIVAEQEVHKARAAEIIASLDAQIAEKSAEHARLLGSVSVDDAVDLIMRDIAKTEVDGRCSALDTIRSAGNLGKHIEVDTHGAVNGNGEINYGVKSPKPLHLLRDISASALVSILPDLFRPAIEALARKELLAAGSPVTGPGIAALKNKTDVLFAELRSLNEQRTASVKILDSLLAKELKLPPGFVALQNRRPAIEFAETPRPMVRHFDDAGNQVTKVHGPSWDEMWAHREARERAENAAQLVKDKEEFGDYKEGMNHDAAK